MESFLVSNRLLFSLLGMGVALLSFVLWLICDNFRQNRYITPKRVAPVVYFGVMLGLLISALPSDRYFEASVRSSQGECFAVMDDYFAMAENDSRTEAEVAGEVEDLLEGGSEKPRVAT